MSKLETNQVDPSTGTTLTLGTSGDTIAIPSGVTIANSGTATGFSTAGITSSADATAISIDSSEVVRLPVGVLRLQNSTTGTSDTDGLLIEASGNDVYINQRDNGAHTATITLSGTHPTDLDLIQRGNTNQSYTLTQNCLTTGGCSVSVTQGN